MTRKLTQALQEQKKTTKQNTPTLYGSLGIPLNGQRVVHVQNRNAFVWVRLRDNQNEVVQAFNNKVAASYNLPVILHREGNRYVVDEVNTERYENNWNNSAPYLPQHGTSHSFPEGGGADIAWIFARQFMPSLVYPDNVVSGTNARVWNYPFLTNNAWKYTGGTGTFDLVGYRPTTGSSSLMVLVYLDATTGNPGVLVNSGTYFPNSITGSVYPYLPVPNDSQIPLAGIRLSTGTTNINWNNVYDVRQFFQSPARFLSSGSLMFIQDEGVPKGIAYTLNFVGSNVEASVSGTVANISITGSSGGAGSFVDLYWVSGSLGINPIRAINPTNPQAVGNYAFAIGQNTVASGTAAVAWGADSRVIGNSSHVGGSNNQVFGNASHSYGSNNTVSGTLSSIDASSDSSVIGAGSTMLGGIANRLVGDRSVMLGGAGVNKEGDDTTFVQKLNVDVLQSGLPISWLGATSNGSIISGSLGIQDEGIPKGGVLLLNFTGNLVDVSVSGTVARVHISGGNSPDLTGFITGSYSLLDGRYQPSGTGNFITGSYTLLDGRYQPSGTSNFITGSYHLLDGRFQPTGTTIPINGWNPIGGLTFISSDSPSFVVTTPTNITGTIGVGDRVWLTHQSISKYFIVTQASITGSTSYLNLYGGTDYDLNVTGAITNPYYSQIKFPFGFPTDPSKWTVSTITSDSPSKASPTNGVWYGGTGLSPTGPSLDLPIGTWRVFYRGIAEIVMTIAAITAVGMRVTLSTANNSESDIEMTTSCTVSLPIGTDSQRATYSAEKFISISSKTTYYLNIFTGNASATSLTLNPAGVFRNVIKAVCAYL